MREQDATEFQAQVTLLVDELGYNRQYLKDFELWDLDGVKQLRRAGRAAARRLGLHVMTHAARCIGHVRVHVIITDSVSPELQAKEEQAALEAIGRFLQPPA